MTATRSSSLLRPGPPALPCIQPPWRRDGDAAGGYQEAAFWVEAKRRRTIPAAAAASVTSATLSRARTAPATGSADIARSAAAHDGGYRDGCSRPPPPHARVGASAMGAIAARAATTTSARDLSFDLVTASNRRSTPRPKPTASASA